MTQEVSKRSKVLGMFAGVAVGDALGMPVECMSQDTIRKLYDKPIRSYISPNNNKYLSHLPVASITDDTQLTIATMRAVMDSNGFCMNKIAEHHVHAMKQSTDGWGKTTREAVEYLANGVHWKESGKKLDSTGLGNGVVMKVAPLAALYFSGNFTQIPVNDFIVKFASMTHFTKLAARSGVIHTNALVYCLMTQPSMFDVAAFLRFIQVLKYSERKMIIGDLTYSVEGLNDVGGDLFSDMEKLNHRELTTDFIIREFGGGSPYVLHSLPFSYAFFLRNPRIYAMYDVINAGGDTDTNASIVGGLVGALRGVEVFEDTDLLDELPVWPMLKDLGYRFCDQFNIE